MSKLAERLRQLSKSQGLSVGFTADRTARKGLPILLIACLPKPEKRLVSAAVRVADALLIEEDGLDKGEGTSLADIKAAADSTLWGLSLNTGSADNTSLARQAGCDFILLPPRHGPLALLLVGEMGKVLELDPGWPDSLVASTNFLDIDAVLLRFGVENALTIHDLMSAQRSARAVRKPVLATAPFPLQAKEIELLWKAGVDGLVLSMQTEDAGKRFSELRQAILALPPSRRVTEGGPLIPPLPREEVRETDITEEPEELL